jgi:hypothetical protein
VQVGVGHLEAGDHHPDAGGGEGRLLGPAHGLGHPHAVGGQVGVEVDPVVDLLDGHHQGVAGRERGDGEERHHPVVPPHEPARELAVDDAGEDAGHGPMMADRRRCPPP